MEKVHKCGIRRKEGHLYYIDSRGNVVCFHGKSKHKEIVCPNGGEFVKEPGWIYYLDKAGDVCRSRMKSFREYAEVREEVGRDLLIIKKIQD